MIRFIKKLVLLLVLCTAIGTGCCLMAYTIDPYNVFHWNAIRQTGIEPNNNYVKTKFLLSNLGKYDALLFGSSRVGAIHVEKIKSARTFNMTYSEGIPLEHYDNLKTLVGAGMKLKRVYIGIDDILLYADEERHRHQPLRCPFEYVRDNPLYALRLYADPVMLLKSLRIINKKTTRKDIQQIYEYGWWADYGMERNTWEVTKYYRNRNSKIYNKALMVLKEINKYCHVNEIELIIFTNPMYMVTYDCGLNVGYHEFLRALSNVCGFYNFSGLNDITMDRKNYLDVSHYKAEIGDLIINVIENGYKYNGLFEDGFGWYVNKDNVENLLKVIEHRRNLKEGM